MNEDKSIPNPEWEDAEFDIDFCFPQTLIHIGPEPKRYFVDPLTGSFCCSSTTLS